MTSERTFTIEQARAVLATLLPDLDAFVDLRARLAAATHEHRLGVGTTAVADLKAMEARAAELLDSVRARGVQVKGFAPLLLDFPTVHEGRDILLCWLEGERSLAWYHDAELGFPGRRRIEDLR